MHLKSFTRKLRWSTIILPLIVLAGCWGNGSGPSSTPDAKAPPQEPQEVVGELVNTPVSGAEWASGGESGLTVNGEYPYTEGDTVTFSVGDISLGVAGVTVVGADTLTPVELTGSGTPVEQAATNMFVFLQTIDENSPTSADGIQISAATRLAFEGQSLDFNTDEATFTQAFQDLLDAVLPGTKIVSEEDALDSFCENTYLPGGGESTFGYPFPGCEFGADVELLTNGGFESPDATGGDIRCSNSWQCFNGAFTVSTNGPSSAPVSHDQPGTQSLKLFGIDGIAQQDVAALPGQTYNASVWAMNWTGDGIFDPFNEFGFLALFFVDSNGNEIGDPSIVFVDTLDDGINTYLPPEDGAEVSDWTELRISEVAPAGTVKARMFLIHQIIQDPVLGGTLRWDDASLTGPAVVEPPPEDFKLVWSDEFNVNGPPSPANWTAEIGYGNPPGWGNNEWQLYTDDPANVRVENGNLVISAQCGTPGEGGTTVTVPVPNGGFESPDASGGDVAGAGTPWTSFNSNFTSSNLFGPPVFFVNPDAHSGTQVLKQFGVDAGSFQDLPATAGDTWEVSAWAQSWSGDENNNTGLLQVFFRDDSDVNLCDPGGFEPCGQVTFDTAQPIDTWIQLAASAVAPAGTTIVRIQLILVPDNTTPPNGALFWDDVTLTTTTPGAPVECDAGVRTGTVTSARINTNTEAGNGFDFTYGKIEARIKPPVGEAAWPAFWMLGSNFPEVSWPNSGEIDIMEMWNTRGSNPMTAHSTMHWCGDEDLQQAPRECPGGVVSKGGSFGFPDSLGDDFHLYTAIWDSDKIDFFVDDTRIFSGTIDLPTMAEFTRDFFMILNVAMGGTLGSDEAPPTGNEVWPQTMLVDYVRVYQAVP